MTLKLTYLLHLTLFCAWGFALFAHKLSIGISVALLFLLSFGWIILATKLQMESQSADFSDALDRSSGFLQD